MITFSEHTDTHTRTNRHAHTKTRTMDHAKQAAKKAADELNAYLGRMGLDVDVEVHGKSKKVRFYVSGTGNNGYKFDLGMDATFEEKW